MGLNSSAAFSLQFLFIHIKNDYTFSFVAEKCSTVSYNDLCLNEACLLLLISDDRPIYKRVNTPAGSN